MKWNKIILNNFIGRPFVKRFALCYQTVVWPIYLALGSMCSQCPLCVRLCPTKCIFTRKLNDTITQNKHVKVIWYKVTARRTWTVQSYSPDCAKVVTICSSLHPPESTFQTASRSVQPFLQWAYTHNKPTDRPHYCVCNNRPHSYRDAAY